MGPIQTLVGAAMKRRDDRLIRAAFEWWDFDGSYGCVEDWENITDEDRAQIIAQADQERRPVIPHDDLTDDAPTDVPWFPWIFFAVLLAAVAWFATDGGEGSYPKPLSPPISPSVAETPASAAGVASGAPAPTVEPRTPKNCTNQ